jgi:hypothetical protein
MDDRHFSCITNLEKKNLVYGLSYSDTKMSITKFFILNDGKNISSEEQVVNIDIDTL